MVVALAVIFLVASVTPMSIFVLNLATLLGLGLGVDYSLLMTSRFREELALRTAGRATSDLSRSELAGLIGEAIEATVATAGRAVFFSGLTVLLGLTGMLLFEFMIIRSVGLAGAVVVGLAVLAALTLLPAVLSILGPNLDRLAVRHSAPLRTGEGAWARLAHRVMDHPDRGARPDAWGAARPRNAVPARPLQRPGRDDPAADRAVAGRLRPAPGSSSARASSRR